MVYLLQYLHGLDELAIFFVAENHSSTKSDWARPEKLKMTKNYRGRWYRNKSWLPKSMLLSSRQMQECRPCDRSQRTMCGEPRFRFETSPPRLHWWPCLRGTGDSALAISLHCWSIRFVSTQVNVPRDAECAYVAIRGNINAGARFRNLWIFSVQQPTHRSVSRV